MSNIGLYVSFDVDNHILSIYESSTLIDAMVKVFSIDLGEYTDIDCENIENTLGQLILYLLHRRSEIGIPFAKYETILSALNTENFNSIYEHIDFTNPTDQYDYATLLFSHGRKANSWAMIEKAEYWFQKSAAAGNKEAKRFLCEDLPVLKPRLEEKLKNRK